MAGMDDPRFRADRVKGMLRDVMQRAQQETAQVDDAQARALFEVTAEVLGGLVNSYEHYEAGTEPAWRQPDLGHVTAPR